MVVPNFIVLDAEALSMLANEGKEMLNWLALAKRTGALFRISTITLAEAMDGSPRDARIENAIRIREVRAIEVTKEIAKLAGKLRIRAGNRRKPRDLTVDSIVAATAMSLPGSVLVLTTDTSDLNMLLDATTVRVMPVGAL